MNIKKLSKILALVIAASVLPLMIFPSYSFAETPEPTLTKITHPTLPVVSTDNRDRALIGSTFFFVAETSSVGRELWKWNYESGVELVKDIVSGPGSSLTSPIFLTVVNDTLFFVANGGDGNGVELWKSDGTASGTVLVKDIREGSSSSSPVRLTAVGNTLFFGANDGKGYELWKSDGTGSGTVLVKDISPGINSGTPSNLTAFNNTTIFFVADSGTTGVELWKSDGTEEGTVLVKDINPLAAANPLNTLSSNPQLLTVVGDTLFFVADNGTSGNELWKSDGTEEGTVLVKDINLSGNGIPSSRWLKALDTTTVLFVADSGTGGPALWKSDGTEEGTVLVKDINPTASNFLPTIYSPAVLMQDNLYFSASIASSVSPSNSKLWKSDGTETGTVLVRDISPGPAFNNIFNTTVLGEELFFSAMDTTVTGVELWKSDGTETGTVLVKDIWPGSGSSTPGNSVIGNFLAAGSRLFFVANDGSLQWWVLDLNPASEPEPMPTPTPTPTPTPSEPAPTTPAAVVEEAPVGPPAPPQTSSITGTPEACYLDRPYEITGVFDRSIVNVQVNGALLVLSHWNQTASALYVNLPSGLKEDVRIQIYNGAAPVLPLVVCKISVAPVVTPSPSPTPTPTPAPSAETKPAEGAGAKPETQPSTGSETNTATSTEESLEGEGNSGSESLGIEETSKLVTQSKRFTVFYGLASATLDAKAKKAIRSAMREVTSSATTDFKPRVRVTGWVQPTRVSPNVAELSNARARAVVKYLRSLGMNAIFTIRAPGFAKSNDPSSRKATVSITWAALEK